MEQNNSEERHELTGRIKGRVPNRNGRPKGAITKNKSYKVEDRLRYKHKRHPVDELIKIVDSLYMKGKYEEAGEIWLTLLKFMELTKRPVDAKEEKQTPQGSVKAAEKTLDLMKELEKEFEDDANTGTAGTGGTGSVENGNSSLQTKAGAKEDLQDPSGQQGAG